MRTGDGLNGILGTSIVFAALLACIALLVHLSADDDAPNAGDGRVVDAAKSIPVREIAGAGSVPSAAGTVASQAPVEDVELADPAGAGAPAGADGSAASIPAEADEQAAAEIQPENDPAPAAGTPIVQVRRGRKIEMRDAPGGELVAELGDETEFHSPTVLAAFRQRQGWIGVPNPSMPNGELGWIRADPRKLIGGSVEYSIVVDLSERTAHLRRGTVSVRSWTVSVGTAETPTPIGRFAVTDSFRGGLSSAYGCCALALTATQPNLPPGWQGGNRIAFHGTDGELGVATSSGCLRSADQDVSALVDTVPLGTPVRIHE